MTVHDFARQKARGATGELFLDRVFVESYRIRRATEREQRRGIDRVFTNRETGRETRVEYKTDYRAAETHNAFVETVSVDSDGKQGWAYTSEADYLVYYVPGDGLVYVLALETLREQLPRWAEAYPHSVALNDGYNTHGVLVPLDEFEEHAAAVLSV